jgi:NAD+ synthase (glutamine-hydrolysing)
MKIALAQLNFHIGNFDYNVNKIISSISSAKSFGAELIVFPELSICGYPPRDFLEFDDFNAKCESAVSQRKREKEDEDPKSKKIYTQRFIAKL